MSWIIYTRGTIHPHRVDTVLKSIYDYSAKLLGVEFYQTLYINIGNKLWWSWNKKETEILGEHILKICSDNAKKEKHFKDLDKLANAAIKASENLIGKDLKKYSNEKLDKAYDDLYKKIAPVHGILNPEIDIVDIIFEDFLKRRIKKELTKKYYKKLLDVYSQISIPAYQSYINQEEKEIIKLALKKNVSNKDINKIYNKFWWTKLGWENMTPHTRGYFEKEIKKYKKKKNLAKKLNEINQRLIEIKKQRNELIKKYNISDDLKYWLQVVDKYAYYHDLRKEMQVKTTYALHLLMSEVARRFKLAKNDLEWLWHNDIQDILRGKPFNKNRVQKRKKAVCSLVTKNGIKKWAGQEAIKIFNKEINIKVDNIDELKGVGVTKGKVRAKVKVCNGAEDALKKIKKGDILVCGMTLPDYVPAMRKASAIITDEGGITCHAAIVSRELEIPCIVGTKIATQILKDGDEVKVDAEKGMIKKI